MMKHNPTAIAKTMKQVGDTIVVSEDTVVHVPEYFRKKKLYVPDLSKKEGVIKVMGSYGIIQGNNYAKSKAPCFIHLTPSDEKTITRDDMDYIELSFAAGSTFIATLNSVHEKIPYVELFVNYMLNGKVPWYLDYEDVVDTFLDGEYYAGLLLESRPETLELLHSFSERVPGLDDLIRSLQRKNPKRSKIDSIPLSNVAYGASTALTKVTGSYQSAGLDHALVTTTTKLSAAERILRDIDE